MTDQIDTIATNLERIRSALQSQRVEDALAILQEMHPADQAELFNFLSDGEQILLLSRLDIPSTADLLEELEDSDVLDAVESLDSERLADLLDEMEPDEAADLIGDLSPAQASEVLAQMEDLEEVLPLLWHPDETAGGLMTTRYIALRRQTTAEQAINFLREVSPETEVPYYLYVVDREKRLVGVVGLRELIVAKPSAGMESIMDPEVNSVTVGTDQEEVAHIMTRYDLANLPVVDEHRRLVGVITHDDLVDVLEDEATEDILRLSAIESGAILDKPYWSQRITDIVRSRFVWLVLLFGAATFTGTVLRHFQDDLEQVVALSFFVPLLIGTGGNAGFQTVSTVIRALALREVRSKDVLRVWWREARAGLLLGLMLGVLGFLWATIWGVDSNIAITVALTVSAICFWATTVASLIPIAAYAVRIDPTVVSGPLMSTLIDGTGLIIYFTLAALILPQLN